MADWLAFGLEDVFAENPEFAILRRPPTSRGSMPPRQRACIRLTILGRRLSSENIKNPVQRID
jgi:hypothetical protein